MSNYKFQKCEAAGYIVTSHLTFQEAFFEGWVGCVYVRGEREGGGREREGGNGGREGKRES